MITYLLFIAALLISLTALAYLALTDPKRRRITNAPKRLPIPRNVPLGWLAVLLPGIPLLILGELSAFVSWLGAITVSGWLLVINLFRNRATHSQ